MILREYQTRTVTSLFDWWTKHQEVTDIPLLVLPTAAGKSVICAEVVRQMWEQWPLFHPRTVVLVPSKELAEQNAEKLQALLPSTIKVGFVSASLGKKQHDADVIVATIGSIVKSAHLLGDIKMVIIDEAHLVDTKPKGMYRTFLSKLSELCEYRTVGMTATPFRGNGVWLTDGDEPLFTGIASRVSMRELLDAKFIAPLVPPDRIETRIDASNVGIANGDYKIGELSREVNKYLSKVALEAVKIALERKKWIAFTPSVKNAESLADRLNYRGIVSAVVCGETPKQEREDLIRQFRDGEIHCLVTVLALSVGFDVPDVDCIIWCRPTKSPVLYVQGMGRGTRIADGKTDCLVLDFTDTVERLGPVDTIQGRAKKRSGPQEAPYSICPDCGERNAPTALVCIHCGGQIREEEAKPIDASSELLPYDATGAFDISKSIDGLQASYSAFKSGQYLANKEIVKYTANGQIAITSLKLDLDFRAISTDTNSKFILQGSADNVLWDNLSAAPVYSMNYVAPVSLILNNDLQANKRYKYFIFIIKNLIHITNRPNRF